MGCQTKDVEMYHHVSKGTSSGTMRFGVAIWNANTSSVSINYKMNSSAQTAYLSGNQFMNYITPQLTSFLNSGTSTVTVNANSIKYFTFDTAMTGTKSIWYRGQFRASRVDNVWMRIFVAGNNKINNSTELFNLSGITSVNDTHFTGELGYSQKLLTSGVTLSPTKTYELFATENENINEYAYVNKYKTSGARKLIGNYGVVYKYTISGASGKTARITPKYVSSRTHAAIVYRVNNGSWNYSYKSTDQFPFGIYIPSNTTTLEVVLVSGNHGYMTLSFV